MWRAEGELQAEVRLGVRAQWVSGDDDSGNESKSSPASGSFQGAGHRSESLRVAPVTCTPSIFQQRYDHDPYSSEEETEA